MLRGFSRPKCILFFLKNLPPVWLDLRISGFQHLELSASASLYAESALSAQIARLLGFCVGYVLSAMAPEDKKAWHSGKLPRILYGTSQKPSRGVERWTKGRGPVHYTWQAPIPSMRPDLALRTGNRRQALRMKISFNLLYPPTINIYWRHVGGHAIYLNGDGSTATWQWENYSTKGLPGFGSATTWQYASKFTFQTGASEIWTTCPKACSMR